MKDLEHYLGLDWRFREILETVTSLAPGSHGEAVIGDFWRFVYSGDYTSELDLLRARAKALAEYIGALEKERSIVDQVLVFREVPRRRFAHTKKKTFTREGPAGFAHTTRWKDGSVRGTAHRCARRGRNRDKLFRAK
jgi:hypothetical protein